MSGEAAGGVRRPAWLRKETLLTPEVIAHRERIARLGLQTQVEVVAADLFPPGRAALRISTTWMPGLAMSWACPRMARPSVTSPYAAGSSTRAR